MGNFHFSLKMHFKTVALLLVFLSLANGEKFSALSEMEELARDESKILLEFEKFLATMSDVMKYLKL